VTTARVSVEEDRNRRMRNYLIAMGVRIVGFPVSVWLLLNGFVVVGALLAACATVMPSIAVVIANAVDRRGTSAEDAAPVSPVQGLGPGAGTTDPGPRRSTSPDEQPIPGTVVSSRETPYPLGEDDGARPGGDARAAGDDDRREAS
jgi:hypothetical protein